jgi:6-phosphogluconolactonase
MPGACRDGIVLQVRVEILFLELGMLKKAAAVFLICASTAIWQSCLIGTSSHILYASLPQSAQIVEYREDPNSGILTQLATSPATAGTGVQALAVHPTGKFLYAANAGENDISLFTIEPYGQIVEVVPRTVTGTSPTLLVVDSAGKFLYVGNSGSQNISVFSIDSTSGALTQVGNPFQVGISPLNMKLSPSGSFLYVTGASPQAGTPGYIETLATNAGVLSLAGPITQPGSSPYGIAISPNGSYLYTANFGDNTISEFSIDSTSGLLTPIAGSPVGETYTGPVSLLVDPSGKYLYVANQQSSGNVAGYTIGTDGSLSLLTSSPYPTGTQPNFIATDPGGNFLFVGNLSKPVIEPFCLASSHLNCNAAPGVGSLTEVTKYPLGGPATSIVVSP